MEINKSIFKAYDIRGIYPTELNEESARLIAQTFLKFLSEKLKKPIKELHLLVGRDNRQSSEPLLKAVIEVFLEYGVKVDDAGLISANDHYFGVGRYKYDGGFVATASHNPPEYGGFKMSHLNLDNPDVLEFIAGKKLLAKMEEIDLPLTDEKRSGTLQPKDFSDDHLNHILSFVDLNKIKTLKVVVDSGNGMNALMIPKLFAKLPGELIHIFDELDGTFPNRPPNPLTENAWQKCGQKILETRADLGIMFDVDGDRMFLVDEKGQFIRGDMALLMMARPMLEKFPGSGIVYNLICSHAVKDLVKEWGGKPIRSEVGYMNLARHMFEEGGVMSGEVSGHFAFKDNYYADNAFVALVLALQAISKDGRKLSEIMQDYRLYARGDEINLKVEGIPAKLDMIREKYRENILDEMDGITVEFDDWWFNVRASNTEPLLRVTVEARTEAELKEKQAEIVSLINN